MGYLIHAIPGRMRIRIPSLRYNSEGVNLVKNFLENLSGVKEATCNQITGSVVVYYDEKVTTPSTIIGHLKEQGYLSAEQMEENIQGGHNLDQETPNVVNFVARVIVNVALDMALKNTPLSFLAIFV